MLDARTAEGQGGAGKLTVYTRVRENKNIRHRTFSSLGPDGGGQGQGGAGKLTVYTWCI